MPAKEIDAMLGTVDVIRLILLENRLSGQSVYTCKDATQDRPASNSPVERAVLCSPAAQAAHSRLPGETELVPGDTSVNDSASRSSPAASSSPLLPSAPGQAAQCHSKADAELFRILALPKQQGFLEACIAEATCMTMEPIWQTPSSAVWKQICTIAVRAINTLVRVSLLHTGSTDDNVGMLKNGLMRLLHELLIGHLADAQLDFGEILQAGVGLVACLWGTNRERPCFSALMTQVLLHRIVMDLVQGRLKQTGTHMALSMLNLLSKVTGGPTAA